ncbi:MAG: hypothetical protein AB1657_03150 [Candidatus Micrarchaeota archaeon]
MEWRGIRFYRVEAECKSDARFSSIGVSLDITGMEKTGEDELRITFAYRTEYRPGIASIRFDGLLLVGGKKAELDGVLSRWNKEKMLPKEMFETLVNLIKYNAEANGVLVAKALSIAPPVVAPKIQVMPRAGRR